MSYLVLARKYRPKTFTEVVGQEHVTRTLANAFRTGRIHHAFLFCGPRGVGKTTLARILGKALNCQRSDGPTPEPCGSCSACESITNGSAVDYLELDGASNRGIDSIRELTETVRYQPAVLRKKVYVIDEVHMLTTEAFNALLKTLEEPPPHVCFVLATTEPHKILNTILSRCQRYDFKLVPAQRLSAHLQDIFQRESIDIEPGAVSLIVRESGGSVRDSLSLCDQVISYVGTVTITEVAVAEVLGVADRSLTRSLVNALATGDARGALEAAETAAARGVDEVQLARAIVRYLRDLAVIQVAPESTTLVEGSAEELAELLAQARAIDRSHVVQMFDRMVRACDDLARTQQPRLVLDLALIDVASIEPMIPLGELIERLGELERRLGNGAPAGGSGPGSMGQGGGRAAASRRPAGAAPLRADAATASSEPPLAEPEPMVAVRASAEPVAPVAAPTVAAPAPKAPAPTAPAYPHPPTGAEPVAMRPPPPGPAAPRPVSQSVDAAPMALPVHAGKAFVPSDMLAEWAQVLSELFDHKRSLSSIYEHAQVLAWDEHGIQFGFTPDWGYLYDLAIEPDKLRDMKAFLAQRYGGPGIDFKLRMLSSEEASAPGPARSVSDMNRQRAGEERRKREAEARMHPIYTKVVQTFGAPVREEIHTDV